MLVPMSTITVIKLIYVVILIFRVHFTWRKRDCFPITILWLSLLETLECAVQSACFVHSFYDKHSFCYFDPNVKDDTGEISNILSTLLWTFGVCNLYITFNFAIEYYGSARILKPRLDKIEAVQQYLLKRKRNPASNLIAIIKAQIEDLDFRIETRRKNFDWVKCIFNTLISIYIIVPIILILATGQDGSQTTIFFMIIS